MIKIKLLSEKAINKIAAGEVIERPISVVKELLENAIDAKASVIAVRFTRGGRTLISVSDNGCGISKDQMMLAMQRHATSKIQEDDLSKILCFGFRGEALPSIASVGVFTLTSKIAESETAWQYVTHDNDNIAPTLQIAKHDVGTTAILRDIFCFTPNRIKFLKSEASENAACINLLKRFALSHPTIHFILHINDKEVLNIQANEIVNSLAQIIGEDFAENSTEFFYEVNNVRLHGYLGLPTFNHVNALKQYYFVNKRSVKDKLISHAVKTAYADLIPHHRYPAIVLFLECSYNEVDVNVHPTKSEVRFADEQMIRRFIIDAIRSALKSNKDLQFTNLKDNHHKENFHKKPYQQSTFTVQPSILYDRSKFSQAFGNTPIAQDFMEETIACDQHHIKREIEKNINVYKHSEQESIDSPLLVMPSNEGNHEVKHDAFLGYAIAQIEDTYIISLNTRSEIIITDQHAAHERITLESMKKNIKSHTVENFLIPEVLKYDSAMIAILMEKQEMLSKLGLEIKKHGINEIMVTSIPSILSHYGAQYLIDMILEDLQNTDTVVCVESLINCISANIACKNSIKAGQKLSLEEMNALLRTMEQTPFIEQCNHGRPTYIKINHKELKNLFERR